MVLNHEPGSSRPPHSFHPGTSPGQGLERMGVPPGVWRGGGQGRYSQLWHLAGWLQWPVPWWSPLPACGWRLPVGHAQVALGSPQLAHRPGQPRLRAQKLDPTKSSWSSCRAQGVAATNGPDHLPAAPRGARHARRLQHWDSWRVSGGREGPRSRRNLRPLSFRRAGGRPEKQFLRQVFRRMNSAFRCTPHPALSLVPLRELSERG